MEEHLGLRSVAHLLTSQRGFRARRTLRHFLAVLYCNVDTDVMDKSGGFHIFERSLDSNNNTLKEEDDEKLMLEAFVVFINSKVKTEQRRMVAGNAERIVWDLIKEQFELENRLNAFRLFALFNRLCNAENLLMDVDVCEHILGPLEDEEFVHINKETSSKLGLELDLASFLTLADQHHINDAKLKRLYDQLVRDVLLEERVSCRLRNLKKVSKKNVYVLSVTSKELVVRATTDDLDEPVFNEPMGVVQMRLSLDTVKIVVVAAGKKNNQVLRLANESSAVDLLFSNGSSGLFRWISQCERGRAMARRGMSALDAVLDDLQIRRRRRSLEIQRRRVAHNHIQGERRGKQNSKFNPRRASL